MKNFKLLTKTAIVGYILLANVFISNAQNRKAIIQHWESDNTTDTTWMYFKSDTTQIQLIYIDSLNYVKYEKAIHVKSGYGLDIFVGFFDAEIKEQCFIVSEKKYIEIKADKIWQVRRL